MITYVVCDLFASPARTLVNTVNTVGAMGKGIAKDFKTIYPEMFARYQELCEKGQFEVGRLWLYRTTNKWVLNFPTKKHWRSPSSPEYIEAGLKTFAADYHVYGITDISFPLLGCGNGELDWETQVRPLMERHLSKLPIDIYVHLQNRKDLYAPEHRNLKEMKRWLRGEPESLAFNEVWGDLVAAIVDDPHIVSIGNEGGVRARIGGDEASIVLELDAGPVQIPEDAFLDLWQQLRAAGFLGGEYLPSGLNNYASQIIPLMTKLSYIRKVELSRQPDALSVGLRVVPGSSSKRPELSLAGIGVVEPE